MTLRPNYETRMPNILRLAPYLDLEQAREELAEYAKGTLISRSPMPEGRRDLIESFISGEGHILPTSYGFTDRLYSIIRKMNLEHQPDLALDATYNACVRYFFHPDGS